MKNWKTTISGVIAASGQILPFLGIPGEVASAVSVLGLFLVGLFSKDAGVSGVEF